MRNAARWTVAMATPAAGVAACDSDGGESMDCNLALGAIARCRRGRSV